MTDVLVPVYDATHAGISSLPKGQAAGYSTGTGSVPWTAADWAAHPGAVRIDQDPAARDPTADVLDIENGAATPADAPGWYRAAKADYDAGKRPGQRHPAFYVNLSNITPAVNALIAAGITAGPCLWIAEGLTEPAAAALVLTAGGPFPVIGVQYRWDVAGAYDISVMSGTWLAAVSGAPDPPHPLPPGSWSYPAPGSLSAVPSRAVRLGWAPVTAPAGHPAPASYTAAVYAAGGRLVKTVTVTGLSTVITGLGAGSYEAHVWPNGGTVGPPHASASFTA